MKPRDDAGNDPGTKRKGRLCMITHHADYSSIAYSARVVKKKTGFYMEKPESPEQKRVYALHGQNMRFCASAQNYSIWDGRKLYAFFCEKPLQYNGIFATMYGTETGVDRTGFAIALPGGCECDTGLCLCFRDANSSDKGSRRRPAFFCCGKERGESFEDFPSLHPFHKGNPPGSRIAAGVREIKGELRAGTGAIR